MIACRRKSNASGSPQVISPTSAHARSTSVLADVIRLGQAELAPPIAYSHSMVPGGFDVTS